MTSDPDEYLQSLAVPFKKAKTLFLLHPLRTRAKWCDVVCIIIYYIYYITIVALHVAISSVFPIQQIDFLSVIISLKLSIGLTLAQVPR